MLLIRWCGEKNKQGVFAVQERIAILNSVYEFGSTGSLAKQLFEYGCANGYEPYVFYGRGQRNSDEHIVKMDSD